LEEVEFGYIRVSRKTFRPEDPFWGEPREFSRFEAWIDLIALAAWKPRTLLEKGLHVHLDRGQLLGSERFFEQRWGWSRGKVRRFLDLLASDAWRRIELKTDHSAAKLGAILTVVNYERYQASPASDEPLLGPVTNHWRTTDSTSDGPKRKKVEELKKNEKAVEDAPRPADADAPPPSTVLTFPCIPGKKSAGREWHLTREVLAEWQGTYPEMDVEAEARKALAYVKAGNSKTHDGMPAFLVRWFNRSQNGGRYVRRTNGGGVTSPRTAADERRAEALALQQQMEGR
jgi:hypothetical protein